MENYKLRTCVLKLNGMETDKALKLVYEWTKTGHISLPIFKDLVGLIARSNLTK